LSCIIACASRWPCRRDECVTQIVALFELTRIVTQFAKVCFVILIDEIDGMCSARDGDSNSTLMVQQFQTKFSRFGGVIVVVVVVVVVIVLWWG
jgi:hypothetical protein